MQQMCNTVLWTINKLWILQWKLFSPCLKTSHHFLSCYTNPPQLSKAVSQTLMFWQDKQMNELHSNDTDAACRQHAKKHQYYLIHSYRSGILGSPSVVERRKFISEESKTQIQLTLWNMGGRRSILPILGVSLHTSLASVECSSLNQLYAQDILWE